MDWQEFETFKGVDLNDSFVLAWHQINDEIEISLEASLWPESPYYEKPNPNEYTCYRKALLKFSGFTKSTGLKSMSEVAPVPSRIEQQLDYGNIETLVKTAKGFLISGEFGAVEIEGGNMVFSVCA